MATVPIVTEKTYSEMAALIAASELNLALSYMITDRGDNGLLFRAAAPNRLENDGLRYMLCPATYAMVSDAYENDWIGVWNATKQVAATEGQLTIWNGLVWAAGAVLSGESPDTEASGWTVIPKASFTNHEYVVMIFGVTYDFENDWIFKQYDAHNNVFGVESGGFDEDDNPVDLCDWNLSSSGIKFINNICWYISNNSNAGDISNNSNAGYISNNSNAGNIEYNSNAGYISNNSNAGNIEYNSNIGEIGSNSNAGRIYYNSNAGYIKNNINGTNIDFNSNIGEIDSNSNALAIQYNSNNGRIQVNSNIGDISSNSNNGIIRNNSNNGTIDNNNNNGYINDNLNGGGIFNNSNAGNIEYNSNIGEIHHNYNVGTIYGNLNTLSGINNNFNSGSIDDNSNSGDIMYNSNRGDIYGNSIIGSIYNNNNSSKIYNNVSVAETTCNIFKNINNGEITGTWDVDVTDSVIDKTGTAT